MIRGGKPVALSAAPDPWYSHTQPWPVYDGFTTAFGVQTAIMFAAAVLAVALLRPRDARR